MRTLLEMQMEMESELTRSCESAAPGRGHEYAQKIISRHEENAKKEKEIVELMLPELQRALAPSAAA